MATSRPLRLPIVDRDGVRDLRVAGDADERSLFALASLTKPFVALAALVAAEEGAIDLDAPAAEHLRRLPPPRDRGDHGATSARPRVGPCPSRRRELRRWRSSRHGHRASGACTRTRASTCSGALIAAATGIDHRTYVTEAVFDAGGLDAHLPLSDAEARRTLGVREPGLSRPGVELFNAPEWRRRGNAAGGAFATVGAYAEVVRLAAGRIRPDLRGVPRGAALGAVAGAGGRPGVVPQAALPGLGTGREHPRPRLAPLVRRRRLAEPRCRTSAPPAR